MDEDLETSGVIRMENGNGLHEPHLQRRRRQVLPHVGVQRPEIERRPSPAGLSTNPVSRVRINRTVIDQLHFDMMYDGLPDEDPSFTDTVKGLVKRNCVVSKDCLMGTFYNLFPFIDVLRTYKFKENFVLDLLAGLSVGIVHIPEGLGFALIAGVPPIYGLYSSFWQPLIYFFLATSRHNSLGTMAIISLILNVAIEREIVNLPRTEPTPVYDRNGTMISNVTVLDEGAQRAGIATCVTLMMGIIQLAMGICRLGILTIFMPMSFVSGFTTAAGIHIATSQVKYLLGIKPDVHQGVFTLINTWIDIISKTKDTNTATLVLSLITITFLLVFKKIISPAFQKKAKVPFPSELLVIILGTLISYLIDVHDKYDVHIVGYIPVGIPSPETPPTSMAGDLFMDAIILAIISFTMSISLANVFMRKHKYAIDSNQELLAYGSVHIISSFNSCFAGASAPPRCFVYESTGGKTSVAHLFSCILLLIVLLVAGPWFEHLPKAVLGSVVVVALLPLFLQFKDLKVYWKMSRLDIIIWMVTFTSTVFLDVVIGLGLGIGAVIASMIGKNINTKGYVMGNTGHKDLYAPTATHRKAENLYGIRIFRFEANLYYATVERFKQQIYKKIGSPKLINDLEARQLIEKKDIIPMDVLKQLQTLDEETDDSNDKGDLELCEIIPGVSVVKSLEQIQEENESQSGCDGETLDKDCDDEDKSDTKSNQSSEKEVISNGSFRETQMVETNESHTDHDESQLSEKETKQELVNCSDKDSCQSSEKDEIDGNGAKDNKQMPVKENIEDSLSDSGVSCEEVKVTSGDNEDEQDKLKRKNYNAGQTFEPEEVIVIPGRTSFDRLSSMEESIDEDDSAEANNNADKFEEITTLIIDCSAITTLDIMGITTLRDLHTEYGSIGVRVVLANPGPGIQAKLAKCRMLGGGEECIDIYPTVQDAVLAKYREPVHIHTTPFEIEFEVDDMYRRQSVFGI